MSLDHTMILGEFRAGLGNTNLIKVTQGSKTTVSMRQQVQHAHSWGEKHANQMMVFNGNIYFPFGQFTSSARGWAKYNPVLGTFETLNGNNIAGHFIAIGDRVVWTFLGHQGWGYLPEGIQARSASDAGLYANDYVIVGEDIIMLNFQGSKRVYYWAYPFTSAPSAGATFTTPTFHRMCELGGSVYAVWVNSGGGTLDLYKIVGGTFVAVGTPSSHSDLTSFDGVDPGFYSLFKFNDKLFFITHTNVITKQKMRLFEIDISAGTSVERNSYLPTEWGNISSPSITTTGVVFEVRDEIGANEQVFIVRTERTVAGWECYEFVEGPFSVVLTGQGGRLYPLGGVIYDPSVKAALIKSAVDTVPSDHIEMDVEVFDLEGQGAVDIDPRYRFNNAEPPPYSVCTGKAPNDGKTGFASVPTGITALTDLSDDFSAGSINDDLWQTYVQSIVSWATARDMGSGESSKYETHRVQQISGVLRFGKDGETVSASNGMGIKGRWSMDGAFQVDFTLKDPDNIADITASFGNTIVGIVGIIRLTPNEGFGFIVWKSTTGPQVKIRGFYMQLDGTFTYSADFNAADGDVVRIVRNGSDVWTLTHDPGGLANDITPGGGSNYSQAVYIIMAGVAGSGSNNWVEPATPDGNEPGFSDIDVSGAGALGLYDGGVKHQFDWDHVTDLTPPKSGTAELFVDSEA